MSETTVERVTRLVNDFDRRVQAAPAGSWGNPAPCDDWTARDVVLHVMGSMNRLLAQGGEPRAIADDADIVAEWNTTRSAFLEMLPHADLTQNVPGPFGPMPLEQVLGRLMATDVLVHTWDLARAVGGDEQLGADDVQHSFDGLRPMDAMIRQPGVFGPKVEPAPDADAQTQFLNFLGRTVERAGVTSGVRPQM
jgi:uncharacterized protein (TIGR03086 family)